MKDIMKELESLAKEIPKAKQNVAVLQDRKKETQKRLKDELGLTSLEAAEKFIEKTTKELKELEVQIQEKYDKLREDFEW